MKCKYCLSDHIVSDGYRINKKNNTKVKKFYCKDCKKYFSEQYEKKYTEEFKNKVIDCHNSRMSTRDIAKIFNISPTTVLYWVKKNFPALKIH